MSRGRTGRRGGAVKMLLVVAGLLLATSAAAKTTGVLEDPAVQSGPCYDALVDKNAATPTTAPNRELGSACQAEQGDVDKAWARVIRLWGSDSTDIPDYDSYRPADETVGGASPRWLSWVGIVLAYVVLGTPMRSVARLMGGPGPASGVDIALGLTGRVLIGVAVFTLLALPGLPVVVGLALITELLVTRWAAPPRTGPPHREAVAGALATHVAEAINDGLGAAAGLAAIALFAQQSVAVFAAGLLLVVVVSTGAAIASRRALRATRVGAAAGPALLAAAIGEVLIRTPPVAAWVGGLTGATIIVPLVLAMLTLAADWRARLPPLRPAE